MRYFRWFILLLILSPLRATAQPTHAMPPPRWQTALYKPPVYYPGAVQCLPVGSVLILAHEFKIIALDRATGRELWRRIDMTEKEADANGPTRKPLAPPGPGNLADYAGAIVYTYWQLFGDGSAEPDAPVAILLEHQTHIVPDSSRPNKQRTAGESND